MERAFELARSGRFLTVGEIQHAIRTEGHHVRLSDPSSVRSLGELIRLAALTKKRRRRPV